MTHLSSCKQRRERFYCTSVFFSSLSFSQVTVSDGRSAMNWGKNLFDPPAGKIQICFFAHINASTQNVTSLPMVCWSKLWAPVTLPNETRAQRQAATRQSKSGLSTNILTGFFQYHFHPWVNENLTTPGVGFPWNLCIRATSGTGHGCNMAWHQVPSACYRHLSLQWSYLSQSPLFGQKTVTLEIARRKSDAVSSRVFAV